MHICTDIHILRRGWFGRVLISYIAFGSMGSVILIRSWAYCLGGVELIYRIGLDSGSCAARCLLVADASTIKQSEVDR